MSSSTSSSRTLRRLAVAGTALLTLGVTACSSSSSPTSAGTSQSSSTSSSTSSSSSTGTSTGTSSSTSSSQSSSSGGEVNGGKPVTLTWWHNMTADPGMSLMQKVADQYHAAHPNVTIKVVPVQNEDIKTKIAVGLQGGTPPMNIFQQWGGGAEATQITSGKLMDMTDQVQGFVGNLGDAAKTWQVNGQWYGLPYDYHGVGFWYRKDIFTKVGISSPPKTLDELIADGKKLAQAGYPIAVGSKDKWPDAFWWENLVLRECPTATVTKGISTQDFSDACFVKAGQDLKTVLDANIFNKGFEATPAQQGAGSSAGLVANGKASMELQGDWEMAVMPSLTSDKNLADEMGWFPFPSVTGGGGDQNAGLGGGDGFSCTVGSTDACPDFLKYFDSTDVQTMLTKGDAITIPANKAASSAITIPAVKDVQNFLTSTDFLQLYFDQALPTAAGNALNDAIANFFAGSGSPQDIPKAVSKK